MVKRVRFSNKVKIYYIPVEDRRGTWTIDNFRFRERIKKFEEIFLYRKLR